MILDIHTFAYQNMVKAKNNKTMKRRVSSKVNRRNKSKTLNKKTKRASTRKVRGGSTHYVAFDLNSSDVTSFSGAYAPLSKGMHQCGGKSKQKMVKSRKNRNNRNNKKNGKKK